VEHTAFATEDSASLQVVGELPEDLLEDFQAEITTRLSEASELKGGNRSAVNGAESHQKTPSFLRSLLQNAIQTVVNRQAIPDKGEDLPDRDAEKQLDKAPQGGFTDVGLHTGCKPRHTTWPLVCAVLHVSIS